MKPRWVSAAVFLLSAVALAYEVALLRIFSIGQWHHFASMVIGIAMLGYGAAGTALAVVRAKLAGREARVFAMAALGVPVGVVGCYELSQRVPFETFELVSRPGQLAWLLALYALLAMPFFFVSVCVALGFALRPQAVGRVYAASLLGAGVGAAGVVRLMDGLRPDALPYVLSLPAAAGFLLASWGRPGTIGVGLGALAALAASVGVRGPVPIRLSPYKGLAQALRYEDARIVAETQNALAWIVAVSSDRIHEAPGEIGSYSTATYGALPRQIALFFDGGGISVVNECSPDATFQGPRRNGFAFLDRTTGALPYHLLENPRVLVLGAGGGTDVLMALSHGARSVTAVELNPKVIELVRGPLGDFSGRLYDRPDVRAVVGEGRNFLQATNERFDLVQITQLGAFAPAAAGVHALAETYLFTREAMESALRALHPQGLLCVTCWARMPPREEFRLLLTLAEALESLGARSAARHLAMARSWNTVTVLASRAPLDEARCARVREFCRERGFDLDWLPGLAREDANRFTVMEEPVYFDGARALLGAERESFAHRYVYDIRPVCDDRPYFFQFFRWSQLAHWWRTMGTEWIPFVEWGYLTLVATVAQGVVAGLALILWPAFWYRRAGLGRRMRGAVGGYFAALGLAYLFVEVAFIQRLTHFFGSPVYSAAVVLTVLLACSGAGSWVADRCVGYTGLVQAAVGGALVLGSAAWILGERLCEMAGGWALGWRAAAVAGLLAPMAFCLGIPFPSGLRVVTRRCRELLPWAWGVNGACSVMGAGLAALVAAHFGLRSVAALGALLYALAAAAEARLRR